MAERRMPVAGLLIRSLGALLAAVVVAAACSGPQGTTFTAGEVTVIDEAGLVTGIVAAEPPGQDAYADAPAASAPDGRLDQVLVVWVGTTCDDGSILRLRGNALTMDIEPRAAGNGSCAPRPMAIILQLNRVIDASSITFRVAGS